MLVIDDGSPDGTGEIADQLARDPAVAARAAPHGEGGPRPRLPGRASAGRSRATTTRCSRWTATSRTTRPASRRCARRSRGGADLALGSRYVAGGGVVDWGLARRIISRGGCLYARLLLGAAGARPDGRLQVLPPARCSRRSTLDEVRRRGLRVPDRDDVPRDAARLRDRRGADRLQRPRARAARRCRAGSSPRPRGGSRSCDYRALRGRIPRDAIRKIARSAVSCSNACTVVAHDRDRRWRSSPRPAATRPTPTRRRPTSARPCRQQARSSNSAAPTITVAADTSALSDVRVVVDGADLSESVTRGRRRARRSRT